MTTILVVDDSAMDRQVVSGFLRDAKYQTEFAEDGEEALAHVAATPPDIVLTDMQMPGMGGLALVKELRARYAGIPVVLMTGQGSETTAMDALRAGAANYIPKANLDLDLVRVIDLVRDTSVTARHREQARGFLQAQESTYVLGYERGGIRSLVSHLQDAVKQMELCPNDELIRVGTALTEALTNAVDHGNLELDSALRESSDGDYRRLGDERSRTEPYRHRRVHVDAHLTRQTATFVVQDEGPGFDVSSLPDPRDPENLNKVHGRGVLLIRTFMDDVEYNDAGNRVTMVMQRVEAPS